jgi:glyoxylase-like metal-dependent hydrolase (beta-lactamase superfamily II)
MPIHFEDATIRIHKVVASSYGNNAYIIVSKATRESIIIDTPQEADKVMEEAQGTTVKSILITHNHFDHLEGFDAFKAKLQVPIASHAADADKLPSPPDFTMADGDVITLGDLSVRAIHTPGHTPGSTCVVVGAHLFSGDTLFPGGPGRSGSPEALQEIIASITGKLFALPDDTAVYPGHGDDTTIGQAKREHADFASRSHPTDLKGDVLWADS